MENLKSCPFCGGKPTLENEGTQADIICDDCYVSNNIQISDYFTYEERHNNPDFKWQDAPIYGYAEKGKQRAIDVLTKLWNTRTSDTDIDALKAELLTLQDRYNAQEKTVEQANLHITAAASGIIGYTSSLKEGDVITKGYIERLEGYYVKNLEQALTQLKAK